MIEAKELTNLDVKKDIVQRSHIISKDFHFAKRYSFDERKEMVLRVAEQSPGRIPVVIELSPVVHRELHHHLRDEAVHFERFKALPENTVAELAILARQKFFKSDIPANAGVFLYVGDSSDICMCSLSATVASFANKKRSPDGWLYLLMTVEATFGSLGQDGTQTFLAPPFTGAREASSSLGMAPTAKDDVPMAC